MSTPLQSSDITAVAAPDREMLIELLGLHARVLRRMPWVQSLLVLGIVLFVYRFIPTLMFLGWSALTIGVEIARARYAASVLARGNSIDPRRTHRAFVYLALAAGSAVAVGTVLFMPRLPILEQSLLAVILFATPAAGVAVSQSSRYIFAAYALSMMLPSCAIWMSLHPEQAVAVATLTLLYCGLMITVSADGEQLLLRSVMIRHERDRLVLDLEQLNSEVRIAMTQAELSAQSRARVLAAASHDLRQPLHALSVYSAVLAAGPPPQTMRELASSIDQIVRSLGNLLHGLLDLSRLSTGHYTLDKQQVALDAVLNGICAEYRRPALDKGLGLMVDLPPLSVIGDPLAIGRIARNLIDNAIKYTDQGSVTVRLEADDNAQSQGVVLRVADTGKGIPNEEQERIFEEFYQLDNPGRDRSKGVGLGLTIVQRLCELSGASVRVGSNEGRGACFEVRLPHRVQAAAVIEGAVPAGPPAALRGRNVFLVDDELAVRHSMTQLLQLWGASVATADSSAATVQLFEQRGRPDLLISDLRLGAGEHGAELALRLRRSFGAFAVLIITGEVSSEALRAADDAGFTLLHKPITQERLAASIATLLDALERERADEAMRAAAPPSSAMATF